MKKAGIFLVLLTAAAAFFACRPVFAGNTNITVESSDRPLVKDQKPSDDDDKINVKVDDSTSLGIDSDGNPALGHRF